ncbi:hypothetical protein MRB53_026335 [Persea americana]|uniref:Uncharacterized protein n=1 Tax=Persea americana TaxID=3435 RepID=A0ACC2LIZ5_PERAE|nr:hypothetical protein MRB53_026335 [Persea americana]
MHGCLPLLARPPPSPFASPRPPPVQSPSPPLSLPLSASRPPPVIIAPACLLPLSPFLPPSPCPPPAQSPSLPPLVSLPLPPFLFVIPSPSAPPRGWWGSGCGWMQKEVGAGKWERIGRVGGGWM